ncbi:ABC transporter ATP-binding protein [Mesorhizobium amorphae]|uniref:ABC transporter ATP-binding protein n=1 Tax=Mesorhizobium amorphae TaxID=71433 RepID=UPI001181FC03|nr:ABC transporter ATP-binding protein [Mesorhizobium amorphae]
MITQLIGFDLANRKEPGLAKAALWGFFASVCDVVPWIVCVVVFHAILEDGDISALAVFAALLLAFFGAWVCKAHALLDSFSATYGLVADMRLAAADRLGRMSLGTIMRSRGATVADLFTDRFTLYQDIVTHMWWQASAAMGFPLLLWLVLTVVEWRIGLMVAAFTPMAILIVPWSFRLLDRATDAVIPVRNETANRIVDVVEGAKEIRLFDPGSSRIGAAEAAVIALDEKSLATELAPSPAIFAFGFVWSAALAAAIILAAFLWIYDTISSFAMMAGLVLAARLVAALSELGVFLIEYRFALRALASIREFVAEPLQGLSSRPEMPVGTSIEIDQVSFAHSEKATFHDISLKLPQGSMTALVGASGAGKSTLVGLVARLWDVDAGAIRIGGVDIRDMTPETLNATVSMVLQDVSLFELSVEDNIRLGRPNATFEEVEAAARAARIHDRILELQDGYETILEGNGAKLSGGERQRLAIARAILKDSPVLILDEATASVDLDNERLIQEALEQLTAHRTVIVIAHRLWTVRDADQIAVLDRGRLLDVGKHRALIERCESYRRLWACQEQARGWHLGSSSQAQDTR